MAGSQKSSGSQAGKVPPRPGRPGAARRPASRPTNLGTGRPSSSRPGPRASARQVAQRQRQRNLYMAMAAAGLVVIVIAVVVVVSVSGGGAKKKAITNGQVSGTYALPASLVKQVESVPVSKMVDAAQHVAASDATPPQKLPAGTALLSSAGHPEVLYVGAEYCPYCAGERWAMLLALSKFGTFAKLRGTSSSATDVNPSTPTFSFYGSTFTSKYVSFVPVEEETNTSTQLQSPTSAEEALVVKWDAPPYIPAQDAGQNPIPFVLFGGKFLLTGIQYDAGAISGVPMQTAASYMTSGTNATSKAAEASAAYLTGDICALTHNQPGSVCSQLPKDYIGINTKSVISQGSSATNTSTTVAKAKTSTTVTKSTTAKKS
jgi:Domain of unknown function (DUF929)